MDEEQEIVEEFLEKLMEGMEESPPEYSEIVDKYFWELT